MGIEHGGLHSAEALLLARYFMFQQVYLHPVRRIYDMHLAEFLEQWLRGGLFSIEVEKHLGLSDVDVLSGIREAARDSANQAHEPATRIADRDHFKLAYSPSSVEVETYLEPGRVIHDALARQFGKKNVRWDLYHASGEVIDFPVLGQDNEVRWARQESRVLSSIPTPSCDYVFVTPSQRDEVRQWLDPKRSAILAKARVQGEEE